MPVSQHILLLYSALRLLIVIRRLMNKLRSASIVRPDVREDGVVRTSNVTKFLAACSSYGLPEEDLFQRNDLIEATSESLARVARTIIALLTFVEAPAVEQSKFIYGQGKKHNSTSSPYAPNGTVSRATASTPNLLQTPLSASPTPPSPLRKPYSPPSGLPTVRSDSPDPIQVIEDYEDEDNVVEIKAYRYPTPPLMTPPPKSPLRVRAAKPVDDGGLFAWARNAASPCRSTNPPQPSIGDSSVSESVADARIRQSVASTTTTELSSILDFSRSRSTSIGQNKFGTIRTVTTDATSEAPSITRTEGSAIADELSRKKSIESGGKHNKDRRVSEGPVVDLSRVVEEADESVSVTMGGAKDKGKSKAVEQEKAVNKSRPPAINLRKGKWPDDFLDAFPAHTPTRVITPKSPSPDEESSRISTPISPSPPRKLAIVGAIRRNESLENLPQFPRRPTHRARHNLDSPVLIPKEVVLGRDGSPDGLSSNPGRILPRRHSSKPGISNRNNGVHFPPGGEARNSESEVSVPFPRTASTEPGSSVPDDKPRIPRGRFRSDIDSAARRRIYPSPNDESGAGARRSRIESMVNLGVTSSNASASDLLSRDSRDSSGFPKVLILRENGKPPTHFVSLKP